MTWRRETGGRTDSRESDRVVRVERDSPAGRSGREGCPSGSTRVAGDGRYGMHAVND